MQNLVRAGLLSAVLLFTAAAQDGHYEGTLSTPNGDMHVAVDIAKNAGGAWIGSSTLSPGPSGIQLDKVTVADTAVSWQMGIPGNPEFKGTWNAEAKSIKGALSARGNDLPLELKRTGDAKVDVPPPSTPASKEIEGKWAGALSTPNGQKLRVELDITNVDGKAKAILPSVDQNNSQLPVTSFVQKGSDIAIEVRNVGAKITGKVNADNTALDLTVDQGGSSLPLKLTRPAPAATVK